MFISSISFLGTCVSAEFSNSVVSLSNKSTFHSTTVAVKKISFNGMKSCCLKSERVLWHCSFSWFRIHDCSFLEYSENDFFLSGPLLLFVVGSLTTLKASLCLHFFWLVASKALVAFSCLFSFFYLTLLASHSPTFFFSPFPALMDIVSCQNANSLHKCLSKASSGVLVYERDIDVESWYESNGVWWMRKLLSWQFLTGQQKTFLHTCSPDKCVRCY